MQAIIRTLAAFAFTLAFFAHPTDSFAQSRPYDLAQLDAQSRAAVENARTASIRGVAASARAQGSGPGTVNFQGVAGDRYLGEGYGTDANVQRNGAGLITWSDGEFYAGEFRAGRSGGVKQGFGVYAFVDGRRYEGEWLDDVRSGYGVQWDANGQITYAGAWANGDPVNR